MKWKKEKKESKLVEVLGFAVLFVVLFVVFSVLMIAASKSNGTYTGQDDISRLMTYFIEKIN